MNQPNQQVPEKETPYVREDMDPETKFYWEILARLRGTAQTEAKEYIASRDGKKCWKCTATEADLTILEFHHLDRDGHQNRRWNLRLVHHPCNTAIYHQFQRGFPRFSGRERARETSGLPSEALDESKPATVVLNEEYEEAYRRYIVFRLVHYGPDPEPPDMEFLVRRNLHAAACEWTGCNPKTGYPYLAKITNPENGFIMESPWRRSGRKILVFRRPEYYELTVDEIARRHPKQGLRMTLPKEL